MSELELPAGVHLLRTLRGHSGAISRVAWSPDGTRLATGSVDATVRIWDVAAGSVMHRLQRHVADVTAVAYSPDGAWLATAERNGVFLWDDEWRQQGDVGAVGCESLAFIDERRLAVGGRSGVVIWTVPEGRRVGGSNMLSDVSGLAVSGRVLAIAGGGGEAVTWDRASGATRWYLHNATHAAPDIACSARGDIALATGQDLTVYRGAQPVIFEGHTAPVGSVSYSWDGRMVASRSSQEVRLWDSDTGFELVVVPHRSSASPIPRLAFHPTEPLLAVPDGSQVYLLAVDEAVLQARMPAGIRYASAKLVLVGDSGVGKTGLGWRLAHGSFKAQAATHGQQFWTLDELAHTRADGAECEAVLWDLAGQQDYRLVHALFLDDADLALVLFDPTRHDDPLRGVDYWLRHLESRAARILVAARVDLGTARVPTQDITRFCEQRGLDGYLLTSALSGEGIETLVDRLRTAISWDVKTASVTTETFKRIKDHVLALREDPNQKRIVSGAELRGLLETDAGLTGFSDNEMLAAVENLSNHGFVSRLTTSRGEARVLLAPELLNNLAASMVVAARRNERGLGALDEAELLAGGYRLAELDGLPGDERDVLLDTAVALFLARNVCYRERNPLNGKTYLVFPALINLRRPPAEDAEPSEDGMAYTIAGAIEHAYASLVVLLGYTDAFTRAHHWHDGATYAVGVSGGARCGFRVESEREGELELVLYFGTSVPEAARLLFQGLVETFLGREELVVRRYEPVVCRNGHRLERVIVRKARAAHRDVVHCDVCGEKVQLGGGAEPRASTPGMESERRTADQRTRFEEVLFRLGQHVSEEAIARPSCFISYAWGVAEHEEWVEQRLASDLDKGGIDVVLDRWENRIGVSLTRFAERAAETDRVIVVGTPDYGRKYEDREPMGASVVKAEGAVITARLLEGEQERLNVLPVLRAGNERSSFPALLRGRVYADFRVDVDYFSTMLDLLLSLYGVGPRERVSVELRALLGDSP